jgi:hypothetical protein
MAYQSTFGGVQNVSRDPSGLLQLANVLKRDVTPALNEYTAYKGEKITEETTAEAELDAIATTAKDYKAYLASNPKVPKRSPFYESVFDSQKGKVAALAAGSAKIAAYNAWQTENKVDNPDYLDEDGAELSAWSTQYDAELLANLEDSSQYYKTSVLSGLAMYNQNISTSHGAATIKDKRDIFSNNLSTLTVASLNAVKIGDDEAANAEVILALRNNPDYQAGALAGITDLELNNAFTDDLLAYVDTITAKGDINADYDRAIAITKGFLAAEYTAADGTRTGAKPLNGENRAKVTEQLQSLLTEKESHDEIRIKEDSEANLVGAALLKNVEENVSFIIMGVDKAEGINAANPEQRRVIDATTRALQNQLIAYVKTNNLEDTFENIQKVATYSSELIAKFNDFQTKSTDITEFKAEADAVLGAGNFDFSIIDKMLVLQEIKDNNVKASYLNIPTDLKPKVVQYAVQRYNRGDGGPIQDMVDALNKKFPNATNKTERPWVINALYARLQRENPILENTTITELPPDVKQRLDEYSRGVTSELKQIDASKKEEDNASKKEEEEDNASTKEKEEKSSNAEKTISYLKNNTNDPDRTISFASIERYVKDGAAIVQLIKKYGETDWVDVYLEGGD